MAWTIDYTETARNQLRRLDRPIARRIVDYMSDGVANLEDPRSRGRALIGPMGGLWRYRVGDCRVISELRDDALRVLVVRIAHRSRAYR